MSEALERLTEALALGEGFQLCLLIVPHTAAADAAIGALQRLLSARLGRPALLTRIHPEAGQQDADALASAVLDPIATLGPSEGLILDGTAATTEDEAAWAELFRRLNARRNGIARQLGRALVLCLTPRLEQRCAREAPDLWSIRGTRAEMEVDQHLGHATSAGLHLEDAEACGLPETLSRIFPHPRGALPLMAELGYPPSRLPLSDASDFWRQVLMGLDQGRLPGGIDCLVRRIARDFPEEPGVQRAMERLPKRVRVGAGWVEPIYAKGSDPDHLAMAVEQPWMAEMRAILRGPPGPRVAIVGRRGSGRHLSWQRAIQDVTRERPWLLACPAFVWEPAYGASFWSGAARAPGVPEKPWGEVARSLSGDQQPVHGLAGELPEPLQKLAPSDPLADTGKFEGALAGELLSRFSMDALVVLLDEPITLQTNLLTPGELLGQWELLRDLWRRRPRNAALTEWTLHVSFLEPWMLAKLGHLFNRVIELGRPSPESLLEILRRRATRASPADRLILESAPCQKVLYALAHAAETPGALLWWTRRLLERWPMPPSDEWSSPKHLAELVTGSRDDLARYQRLGELLDGGARSSEEIGRACGLDVRKLSGTGQSEIAIRLGLDQVLLERDPADPEHFRLAPVASLLAPSVASKVAELAR